MRIGQWHKDISGQKFGRLTAVKWLGREGDDTLWECKCECGSTCTARLSKLRKSQKKSCGCLVADNNKALRGTHLMSHTKEHNTWLGIKRRCYCTTSADYPDYGGRGIVVCDRWLESFEAFYEDMGKCPDGRYSIGRIDNDGPYCKDNCEWQDDKTQANNKRGLVLLTWQGQTHTMTEWADITGIKVGTLHHRLKVAGWSVERALSTAPRPINRRFQEGYTRTTDVTAEGHHLAL